MPIHFPHHWNVNRRSAMNVKWLRLCCVVRKWIGPRGFKVKCVCQDEARHCIKCTPGNEIADSVMRLIGDPLVDMPRSSRSVGHEIERLKGRAEILLHQRQETLAKVVSLLRKEPVSNAEYDRFSWATESFGLLHKFGRLRAHFFQ